MPKYNIGHVYTNDSLFVQILSLTFLLFSFNSDMSDVERTYAYCHILWSFHGCHVSSSSGKIRSLIMIKKKKWEEANRNASILYHTKYALAYHTVSGAGRHHIHLDHLHHCGASLCRIPETLRNSSAFSLLFFPSSSFLIFKQFSSNAINYSLQFKMIFHTKGNNLKKGLILHYED